MSKVIAPTSLDTDLKRLLEEVDDGRMQLPEFQRSWTWDDGRICNILASLTIGYPMGAIMRLKRNIKSFEMMSSIQLPDINFRLLR